MVISLSSVTLEYTTQKTPLRVLADISFGVREGEILSILGPSGCGKSSLLSLIAGLRLPTSGQLNYVGKPITGPSRERVIIFQNHALFPWKTALENIAFALRARDVPSPQAREEARTWLRSMNLESFADFYPRELSGGMQQRVGIARALAADAPVLLLDEPFAALDTFTRSQMQEDLLKIIRRYRKTVVLVTHSIEEAVYLGDRVIVLTDHPGSIRKEIPITLPKPSQLREFETQKDFLELKRNLQDMIYP